jgi:hypothetical protein
LTRLAAGLAQRSTGKGSGDTVSRVIGRMNSFCWSVSFWPQIVLNCQLKAATGVSLNFQVKF